MPASLDELQTPVAAEEFRKLQEETLIDLGFPVESWQDEGAARGFLEATSATFAEISQSVAAYARMVHLGTAEGSFLDATAYHGYDEQRTAATSTEFNASLVNSGTTNHGVQAAGAILLRASNGQVFANTEAANIAASATAIVPFRAQLPGAAGNVPAQTFTQVTPLAGVSASFAGVFTVAGADAEKDPQYRARARAKWGALRVEKAQSGVESLIRQAAPNIHSVQVNAENPRGAGTIDVYMAAANAAAGTDDISAAQSALDLAYFGNAGADPRVKALAAPTSLQKVTATVYASGTTAAATGLSIDSALSSFFESIPIGGFDLSPGPSNVVQRGQIIDALASVDRVVSVDLTEPASDVLVGTGVKVLPGTLAVSVVIVGASA